MHEYLSYEMGWARAFAAIPLYSVRVRNILGARAGAMMLDLDGATHAELSVEYWGGHIGTAGQRFRVNEHYWSELPQPAGTPAEPQRFYRVLHGNNSVPIPLDQLVDGENLFQFAAGRQLAYFNDWGFYIMNCDGTTSDLLDDSVSFTITTWILSKFRSTA